METADRQIEVIDAQIIYNAPEVMPSDEGLTKPGREAIAVELAVASMDAAGVDAGLWHGERSICECAVARYPERFQGIVYHPEPELADVATILGTLRDARGLVGIRLTPAWPPTGENIERLLAGVYDPWFVGAQEHEIPIAFFMSGHLDKVPAVAEAYPALKLLIDHIGMGPPPHVALQPDRLEAIPELLALARHENVAVKLTGVPALSFERYPFADMWPASQQIIEAFGPERVMWGSDFRRLRTLHPYHEVVDFLMLTDAVPHEVKRKLFGESLRAWLGWHRAPDAVAAEAPGG